MPYGNSPGRSIPLKETNNYKGGRSGSKCPVKSGPVEGGIKHNPTKGGGINRATKG